MTTPNTPEREPDPYHSTGDDIKNAFAGDKEAWEQRESKTAPDTIENLEQEPDYIDKLTMVPLPIETMRELLGQSAQELNELNEHNQEVFFKRHFVGAMCSSLERLAKSAKEGDNVTFDDLLMDAEKATEHVKKVDVEAMLNDPSFVAETHSVAEITNTFALQFDQRPELEYIGDTIDDFTIHPDVHSYQKDRIEASPDKDFHGEEYGKNGRWIAEKRGNMTVWVTKEQKQQEAQDEYIDAARDFVNQAHEAPSADDAEVAAEQHAETGPDAQILDLIPDKKRERVRFARANFQGKYSEDKIPLLAAFLQKELSGVAAQVPEGSRYPDTVAAVVGNGGDTWHLLHAVVSDKLGRELEPNEFSRLPFSEVATSLGVDVKELVPDYTERFSPR